MTKAEEIHLEGVNGSKPITLLKTRIGRPAMIGGRMKRPDFLHFYGSKPMPNGDHGFYCQGLYRGSYADYEVSGKALANAFRSIGCNEDAAKVDRLLRIWQER